MFFPHLYGICHITKTALMMTTHTTKGGAEEEEAVRLEEEDAAASKVNLTATKLMRIVWVPK